MEWKTEEPFEMQPVACCCMGPQNGEPFCPCRMRGMEQRNGRWIEPEKDHGPVLTLPDNLGSCC